jgi:carbon-monoxide dehydrogenase medium subunit
VKPRPFAYFAPRTLDDALALLAEHGTRALPLAGGQSLVQRLNMRELRPEALVDLNRIPALAGLRRGTEGALIIGAMTRQQRLVTDAEVRAANPALTRIASAVAFPAIRVRGTLGGSVANAEPGAQLPLLLTVLDAQATIARHGSRRVAPVSSLIRGPRATTLAPDELLIELAIPPLAPAAGYALGEFRRGHSGPPLVSVVSVLELDQAGAVRSARLGVSGATEVPLRLSDEEALLIGQPATPEVFAAVARAAGERTDAGDPVLADAELRRRAMRALLARSLMEAADLARQRGRQEATS